MSADAKLMEAMARIEHKVDLLLELARRLMSNSSLVKVGTLGHVCPVCNDGVFYQVDPTDAVVFRKCGCATGKVALDMKAFAPPISPNRKKDEDEREQEDGSDSTGRRGLSKGR